MNAADQDLMAKQRREEAGQKVGRAAEFLERARTALTLHATPARAVDDHVATLTPLIATLRELEETLLAEYRAWPVATFRY